MGFVSMRPDTGELVMTGTGQCDNCKKLVATSWQKGDDKSMLCEECRKKDRN